MKIAIIGVGTAGIAIADKIDIPRSNKVFMDSEYEALATIKSKGEAFLLDCKERNECPSLYCHCYMRPEFCKEVAESYEEEIRQAIIRAFDKTSLNKE